MAYAVVLVFDGVDEERYWSVNEKLGIGRDGQGDYPPGLLVHAGAPTATGLLVSEIWDSQQSQQAFMTSRLGAALQAADVPAPVQVIDGETVNLQQLG
jgi:hypothetical protein